MTYFITGGTGSFGTHFTRWVLENTDDRVVIFSRDELKQWEMAKTVDTERVKFIVGDVRDYDAVYEAMQSVDGCWPVRVVHAAALKHVHTGELQPVETMKTNALGTLNVVRAANHYLASMVLLSSDKAVEPINLYGASKMVAERYTIDGGQRVVRYGNVFGSRGSILHIFQQQFANGHEFTITDHRMTRFVITFDQAIEQVLKALNSPPGSITIPDLPAIRITDLALAFDADAKFKEYGIQPGEKLAEKLCEGRTSDQARMLSIKEIMELIDETV